MVMTLFLSISESSYSTLHRQGAGWVGTAVKLCRATTKTCLSNLHHLPTTLFPRVPAVSEKTFYASFVPQPAENTTFRTTYHFP